MLAERLLVGGLSLLTRLRGQRARRLLELNDAFLAVLLSADFLGHSRSLRGHKIDRLGYDCYLIPIHSYMLVHVNYIAEDCNTCFNKK